MTTSVDLFRCSVSAWDDVSIKTTKSVVFIDNTCAECLHWHGGALLLFNAGALDIKEFSSFESGHRDQKKGVFILSGALTDTTRSILQHIVEASNFNHILLVTSLSPAMHTIIEYGAGEADESKGLLHYKQLIMEWTDERADVEFLYQPLVAAPITPSMFVLPEHHDMLPLLPTDLQVLQERHKTDQRAPLSPSDINYEHLPKELQLRLKLLVCSLHSMLELLEVSEDVYCLGHTSRMVATELAGLTWAKTRRKGCQQRASVLLVDRSLDVASAVGHHGETVLDKILSTLPHLPQQHTDVCVDMTPVCTAKCNPNYSVIVPGCLAHPDDGASVSLLGTIASTKYKECLMEMNRQIVEAANREKLPIKLTGKLGKVSVDTLESHVSLFKGKTTAIRRNCGLVQLVLATVQAAKHRAASTLDSLQGVEKGLLQSVADEGGEGISPLAQLTRTLQRETKLPVEDRLYSVEDLFLLLLYVYSLAGTDCCADQEEENFLKSVLTAVIQEADENTMPEFIKELVGDEKTEEVISEVLDDLFERLNGLASAREELKQYGASYDAGSITSQASVKPLLKQLVTDILDPARPDLLDIEYKSTGFRHLLKSGFGLFRAASKPRPSDHPLLIVFVVGGVTPTEIKQVKDAVAASKSSVQVLLGGTSLLQPKDLLQKVLVQDNLHPVPT